MPALTASEIGQIGFARVGSNVTISSDARFYGACNIEIGNNVRIDDFCVLSSGMGGIQIGNFVHLAVGCVLVGAAKIMLGNFSGLSSRVAIYSSSDDYSGECMTNPTVPVEFTNVFSREVTLQEHVIVGANSIILPGVTIGEGCAIGSISLVKENCEPFWIYSGIPAKKNYQRNKNLIYLARRCGTQ